jgi:hypothetical protein
VDDIVPIAALAQTGAVASAGFLALGAVWMDSRTADYFSFCPFAAGQLQAHRVWMIRSYALTAAAITPRMWLPIVVVTRMPFAGPEPALRHRLVRRPVVCEL